MAYVYCFRPLDGESFSKHRLRVIRNTFDEHCFRPLDGESFSKQECV